MLRYADSFDANTCVGILSQEVYLLFVNSG